MCSRLTHGCIALHDDDDDDDGDGSRFVEKLEFRNIYVTSGRHQ